MTLLERSMMSTLGQSFAGRRRLAMQSQQTSPEEVSEVWSGRPEMSPGLAWAQLQRSKGCRRQLQHAPLLYSSCVLLSTSTPGALVTAPAAFVSH